MDKEGAISRYLFNFDDIYTYMKKLYSLMLGLLIGTFATFAQTVVYVPAQPTVVYAPVAPVVVQPTTTVVYSQPPVVYATPVYVAPQPVIVLPVFSIGFGHYHHFHRGHL